METLLEACYSKRPLDDLAHLLGTGIDINSTNKYGYTVLSEICFEFQPFEVIKYLVEKGADVNISNNNGAFFDETILENTVVVLRSINVLKD